MRRAGLVAIVLGISGLGCGAEDPAVQPPAETGLGCDASAPPTRTISCVASFEPGKGAGFGEEYFPEIVYGEPLGQGTTGGSTDVLSLGRGGSIVVGFGGNAIVDGAGPDFVVFENAFYASGDPASVFAELAEVSVSADGEAWETFPCAKGDKPPLGCAGYTPVNANRDLDISPFDVAEAGGEAFDLAEVGLAEARFVRIRDLELGPGAEPTGGFDLDAVAIVNAKVP
ncbi:cell surface protein [Polyangium aurulentum]|uniref:cell surface protein n=1 Tax=Polyangium aurulentum TaxID=2567896 RepID=UPI001F1AF62C|nr:cell surface protein [Polyangium aurulentum]